MKKYLQLQRSVLVLSAVFLSLSASAQTTADQQLRYQKELAHCKSGSTTQSRANCQREAGAALAAAQRGDLDDGPAAYERNARERCMALPAPERFECIARMRSPTTGSVAGGGLLREAVTVEPVAPPAPPAQPMK